MTPPAATVACYTSGHGYGHAVRTAEVARALAARGALVVIASDAAAEAFEPLPPEVRFEPRRVDAGVVQLTSLVADEKATIDAFEELAAGHDACAEQEAGRLRALGADAVVADVAPLGVLAAERAGLPVAVVANFTWDEIYRDWADRDPRAAAAADRCAAIYRRADLLLETPLALPLPAFPRRVRIPLVARSAVRPRDAVRADLGLGPDDVAVLVAFGGIGPPPLGAPHDLGPVRYRFLGYSDLGWPAPLYRAVDRARFPHPDLVQAADVVLGKPGYGTVAECALHGTPMAWVGRDRFAEMPALVAGIRDHAGGAEVEAHALASGRIGDALARARATPPRIGRLAGGGAGAAAGHVLELARSGRAR